MCATPRTSSSRSRLAFFAGDPRLCYISKQGAGFVEGERPMSEQPPTAQDFSDHWGFYLLQAITRLDDNKIDAVRCDQEQATMRSMPSLIKSSMRSIPSLIRS